MIKVAAAVIMQDGKVLLARRKQGDKLAGYWEFPGGHKVPRPRNSRRTWSYNRSRALYWSK